MNKKNIVREQLKKFQNSVLNIIISGTPDEILMLEKALRSSVKICEGTRELKQQVEIVNNFPKLEIAPYTINFDISDNSSDNFPDSIEIPNINKDKNQINQTNQEKNLEIENSEKSIKKSLIEVPDLIKKMRSTPVISDEIIKNKFSLVPMKNPAKYEVISTLGIFEDIEITLFGACRSCKNPNQCSKCKEKGGVRAVVSLFSMVEQKFAITVWTSGLVQLSDLQKKDLINAVRDYPEYLKAKMVELYRGRLLNFNGKYSEYNKQLNISVNSLNCITMNTLADHLLK